MLNKGLPETSSVKRPISMALNKVFEPQKPRPSCMIPSGVRRGFADFVDFFLGAAIMILLVKSG